MINVRQMRTPLAIAFSLLLLGCSQKAMKNPFAEIDRETAMRDCRAEVMELPNMTPEAVEFMMAMQGQALDALSRIPATRKNREHLKDTLGFAYPNLIAAKGVYEQMYGKLPDDKTLSEPGGAANGSQPIRSETNRTPPAAGSRR
jgi:hypothetical protein